MLSPKAKKWLSDDLGSIEIVDLTFRSAWVYVGIVGGDKLTTFLEKSSEELTDNIEVSQIFLIGPDKNAMTDENQHEGGQKDGENVPFVKVENKMKSIDYYLGKEYGTDESRFLEWCTQEGVIMPKLEYPAQFENGLIGVRCKETIFNSEAFLFIPESIMFTVNKIRDHAILGPIVE